MNTILRTSLCLAASLVLASATFSASEPSHPAHPRAYAVTAVGEYVERGSLRIHVLAKLGDPAEKLSPDVWVYHRYAPVAGAAVAPDCRTLIVFFRAGVVAEMRLANPAAKQLVAAEMRLRANRSAVAAHVPAAGADEP